MEQRERHVALCRAVALREGGFTLPKLRERFAFTLIELLVVIAILSILLVALIPALSISKSSGRKGAVSNLLGAIEQARAQAIKDGQPTYVVFATTLSTTDQNILQRYLYRSVAIFKDDPANPSDHADPTDPADTTKPKIQVSTWKILPTGISIRPRVGTSPWKQATFAFTPEGSTTTENFSYLMFSANGEVQSPDPTPSTAVTITVFEGFVNGTTEVVTGKKDGSGNPLAAESITIARLTGRAERM
jgi:prepilin-type N-terminal cleavage/methylation domain-containing protein